MVANIYIGRFQGYIAFVYKGKILHKTSFYT